MQLWKKIIGTVAPTVATALGGPLAGAATRAISSALLGKENATELEIAQAVENATPEQLVALKKVDVEFAEIEYKTTKLAFDDTKNARHREIMLKDKTPAVLAFVLVFGFLGCLAGLFYFPVPTGNAAMLYSMIGALATLAIGACNYFHGTTKNSGRKDILHSKRG